MFVPPRYTEAEARAAVAASHSYAEALRRLGMCSTGGGWLVLKKYVDVWGICTKHFDPDVARNRVLSPNRSKPLEEVLVRGSKAKGTHLKERLYAKGMKSPTCELCEQGEAWRGARMSLILDHVNGDSSDNRLENLRILCPNCNATLDTHCGRNGRSIPLERLCARCQQPFRPKYRSHRYCSRDCGVRHDRRGGARPGARKVERPPYARLRREVAAMGYCAVGRRYGVSDNAVRKWLRQYEFEASIDGPPVTSAAQE
jgi:HNH endonuclease